MGRCKGSKNKPKVELVDVEELIYVYCRGCGFDYLEGKNWFFTDLETECPYCHIKYKMKGTYGSLEEELG